MDKLLLFPGKTEQGIFTYLIDAEKNYLEKTACEYHPTIASYIHAARPIKGKTQILLTALGAGEYWGANQNGDYFPETALAHEGKDYGYKTFEYYAKIYKHHVNKDPAASYGDVALSVYNPKYHRVELIVVLDNAKAPDTAERIENGDYPDWSMGTRVPYDICNLCGNKAPTRKQYCEHAKYFLGRIHPEFNRQVYVINTMPKFFDISQVLIGADRIAKTHMKVATAKHKVFFPSSAWLAEKMAGNKAAAEKKIAVIEKEVPADTPPASQDKIRELAQGIMEVKANEPSLPPDVLNLLANRPLEQSMSTMAMLGVLPKPQEFQRIVLIQLGERGIADDLDRQGLCFDPNSPIDPSPQQMNAMALDQRHFDPFLMQALLPFMGSRSYYPGHLGPRISLILKQASEQPLPKFIKVSNDEKAKERKPIGIIPMLALAAGLYAAYGKKAPDSALKGIDKLLEKNPGLAAAIGLGLYGTFNSLTKPGAKGDYVNHQYVNPDTSDVFSRIENAKQKPYIKLGSFGPVSKRLVLGIPAAYIASGVLQKHKELNPYDEEGRIKSFVRRNPDVISGALAADALLASHGKGTTSVLRKFAEEGILPGEKSASAHDFLSNALIWPLAAGAGAGNLSGRVVSGLFDQAVFEAASKLSKRKQQSKAQGVS